MAANPDLEKAKKILSWVQRKEITTFTNETVIMSFMEPFQESKT